MLEKILDWIFKLFKAIWPAAVQDKVAATLLVASLVCDVVALSYWELWERAYNLFDGLAVLLFFLLLLRLWHKSWDAAPLLMVGGLVFLVLLIYFAYRVPSKRLIICAVEMVISFVLTVRYAP